MPLPYVIIRHCVGFCLGVLKINNSIKTHETLFCERSSNNFYVIDNNYILWTVNDSLLRRDHRDFFQVT